VDTNLRKRQEDELLHLLEQEEKFRKYNLIDTYEPTDKQREFHTAGDRYRQRLLMAGNQTGKSFGAACELAYHMTGHYPDWWEGRVWNRPVIGWGAGVTARSTRMNVQRHLLGRGREWGTGTIRKELLIGEPLMARGEPDLVDSFSVRHSSGGISSIFLLNYQQGREKWQGETLDFIWCDEEPPMDIYTEGLTRLNRRAGSMLITFTPLKGMTEVVRQFLRPAKGDLGKHMRKIIKMHLSDATFYTEEERNTIVAQYSEHEREARVKGLPAMGSGMVYPVPDEDIATDPFKIPPHWRRLVGIDLGIGHANAGVWMAHDADADILYVYSIYKQTDTVLSNFADAIKARGKWIPVAWPHDALKRDPRSGEAFSELLRQRYELNMLGMSSRWDDDVGGPQSRERATAEVLERMQTGRFKVFSNLRDWFDEKSTYHRKDGLIVDEDDDLLSATHYATMMIRYARNEQRIIMMPQAIDIDADPLSY
jgi:phage terminase large subunit-like protein